MKILSRLKERSIRTMENTVNSRDLLALVGRYALAGLALAVPMTAFGSVEGSLIAVQAKLVGTILPLAAICGLVMAGFSFVMGHPNARSHLSLAIIGAIVGFGAESIVALIRSLIQ